MMIHAMVVVLDVLYRAYEYYDGHFHAARRASQRHIMLLLMLLSLLIAS
jgi:hypothetical protein